MTSVDRLGFSLRLKTAEGMKGTRIQLPSRVSDPEETRAVLVEMVKQAKHESKQPLSCGVEVATRKLDYGTLTYLQSTPQ